MSWKLSAALVLAASLAGCATNPVTGRPQLALISESQEVQMGAQAAQEVQQTIGLVDDAALQQYVHGIGTRLAARSERPSLPWTFRVVDDPTPNAFALPGGYIFVTRGLLGLMEDEAELSSVLGHEIGHVTARHQVTQISRAQLAQLGLGIGSILVPELQQFGEVAGLGMNLLFLKYGRDAENQADDLGFRYALTEGYDVREMAEVFAALQRVGEREGRSPLPSWLQTHPNPGERIRRTGERVAALNRPLQGLRVGEAEYLGRIDGLVYGENPRNGFFRGGVFLHPDLRFRLDFPQGWRTQNLPQAVVAVSPQQDAMIQLTLGQGSPDAAAQRFFSRQGLQPGQAGRETVNGLPAVVGYFRAQTQQGVVDGVAAFVSHAGRTYEIVAFTPTGRFAPYDRLFRQTLGSFGPLTDPQALAAQPNRIDVVRLDRAMTLVEFNRRYPSAVPLAELAVINGVEGETSPLPAGSLVKRVVPGTGTP
ncbi:MAG TPA: M48 family metalloprotease [Longimicrobiaceae bacterium]|nr:M48 family metalloprotease [Longimicrobiaceae bacterium]